MTSSAHRTRRALAVGAALLAPTAVAGAGGYSFQWGVDGYGGTTDTSLQSNLGPWNEEPLLFTFVGPTNRMALIRFDDIVGPAPGRIPTGTVIDSAVLRVKTNETAGETVNVHRMVMEWVATWTWNNPAYGFDGVQPDGFEAAAGATGSFLPTSGQTNFDVDVTDDVQAWVDGAAPNRGWVLLGQSDFAFYLHASEAEDPCDRPRLLVNWTPPACPGDTNGDDVVDVADLVALILGWGGCDPALDVAPSLPDGVVDVQDLVTLILGWGACP